MPVYEEQKENHLRYHLLFGLAKEVIIDELRKYYPVDNPQQFYLSLKSNIQPPITLEHWQKRILFPDTEETLVEKIDISLGALLIEKSYGSKWKSNPPLDEGSVQSDIFHIRRLRNEHSHEASQSLTKADFRKKRNTLQTILIRRGIHIKRIADVLNEPLNKPQQEAKYFWHHVDRPTALFHGRKDTLKCIHEYLMNDNVVVLTGYGGLGKSQLALKYAEMYGPSSYENCVVAINANGPTNLENSFRMLANEIFLGKNWLEKPIDKERGCDIKIIITKVFKFFSGRRSLFIFDNVNSYSEVKEYLPCLPPGVQGPSLLLTSQYAKWDDNYKVLPVNIFTDAEAFEFVSGNVVKEKRQDPNCVESLCVNLQNLPLALNHAVGYIKSHPITVTEYNKELLKQQPNMPSFGEISEEHYYLYVVSKTWLVASQKLESQKNDKAILLIRLLAFMDNKNISLDFLLTLGWNSATLNHVLDTLSEYSLVSLSDKMVNIHLLVQYAIRMDWIPSKQTLKKLLHTFLKLFNGEDDKEFSILMKMIQTSLPNSDDIWVPHIIKIFHIYKDSKSKKMMLTSLLEFVTPLHDAFERKGQYKLCYDFFKEMYEKCDECYDDTEKTQLYNLRNCMALSLQKLGNLDEALTLLETLRDDYIKSVGEEHSSVVLMDINVVSAMVDKGELRRGKELLMKLITKSGFDDIDQLAKNTAEELHGNIYHYMGFYKESLKIFSSLMEKLTVKDSQMFTVKYNLANCYYYLGEYKSALKMFKDTLKFTSDVFGDKHLYVFLANRSIGKCSYKLGSHEEALTILEDTLDGIQSCFDENHFDYLSALHYKILCLLDFDDRDCSLEYVTKLASLNLEKRLEIYGDNHPYVLLSETAVACCLLKDGKIDGALELLKAVETKQLSKLHEDHPNVLDTQDLISECYSLLKNVESVEASSNEVLGKQTKSLEKFHLPTQQTNDMIIGIAG